LVLLAARTNLHAFLKQMTWPELRSAVLLLAMTFLALPLLPNRTVDPWDSFNPYELWLMTVLIAVLSFAGYVAVRVLGERGLALSAVAGAIVSSTTVTLVNSQLAAKNKDKASPVLAAAICIAWMTGFARVTAIALAVNSGLWMLLVPPMAAGFAVLAAAALIFYRGTGRARQSAHIAFGNPLDLVFVLKFGLLLAAISVAAKIGNEQFGQAGLLGLAGLSGFADVDPITLSSARLAGNGVRMEAAVSAILLASAANLVTKIVLPIAIGGWRFGIGLLIAGGLAAAAAGGAFLIALEAI
jgi:uncharacterized membrane protein (DUF4010 family)